MTEAIQSAIHVALNGLADRQHTSADNIANIQTPGFLAKQTNFEDKLAAALNGQGTDVAPTHLTSQAPTNTNGNNVDLDNETVTAMATELRYQAMISAMNSKFRILKTAMG
jgi:flagellar basal-body rod protein FlgB